MKSTRKIGLVLSIFVFCLGIFVTTGNAQYGDRRGQNRRERSSITRQIYQGQRRGEYRQQQRRWQQQQNWQYRNRQRYNRYDRYDRYDRYRNNNRRDNRYNNRRYRRNN